MRRYRLYAHPTAEPRAIKVGLSWPALVFGPFWLLAKGLWGYAAFYFAMYAGLGVLRDVIDAVVDRMKGSEVVQTQFPHPTVAAFAYLVVLVGTPLLWLVPAFSGNGWRFQKLERRGYRFVAEVEAGTGRAALDKLESRLTGASPPFG